MLINEDKLRALTDQSLDGTITAVMIVIRGLTFGETREDFRQAVDLIGHYRQEEYEAMLDQLCAERHRRRNPLPEWTPFERVYVDPGEFDTPEAEDRYRVIAEKTGRTIEAVREIYLSLLHDEIYRNSRYQVCVRRHHGEDESGGAMEMVHLSVKGLIPGQYMHDWRDYQKIKNALLGPNCEAVELYPAEERLTDTADQWHMWGVNSGTYRFPLGWFEGRLTVDQDELPREGTASQRKF